MAFLKTNIEKIQAKSSNAISVFQKTVTDLVSVERIIDAEKDTRKAVIEAHEAKIIEEKHDIAILDLQREENAKFISKINEFLGIE